MVIFKRAATSKILESAKYFPVIAILGPRQSGKTTLAQTIFKQHRYLSLEDLDLRAAAQHDPRSFLIANGNPHGIIIDEFQLVPDLLSYIQTTVDQQKQPGYFILTGSQNFLMNKAITQSLAGRVSIHTLLPLSLAELNTNQILPAQIETILDLHPSRGNLFEALIISETFKYYFNHNQTPNIYFWRDQAGHEIDCILDEGQQVIPIEIKASRTISQRFFENLKLWQTTYPNQAQPGYIVYAGAADQPRGQTNVISWQTMSQILNYLP